MGEASWESIKWCRYNGKEKKWKHELSISASSAPPPGVDTNAGAVSSSSSKVSKIVATGGPAADPYNLRRFCTATLKEFDAALGEIKAGEKVGHWIWYFFPVAPFVVDGKEKGSEQNKKWCLRDKAPNQLSGDDAARAYLRFASDGVDLREKYLEMMTAITEQLARN